MIGELIINTSEELSTVSTSLVKGIMSYSACYVVIEILNVILGYYYNGLYKLLFSILFSLSVLISMKFLAYTKFYKKNIINPFLKKSVLYKQLLQEPVMRAYFTQFLKDNDKEIYIDFYLSCLQYRLNPTEQMSNVVRSSYAKEIYDLYISPGCAKPITLSEEKKRMITIKINRKQFDVELFLDAENEVADYLINTSANGFLRSQYHEDVKPVNKWFSTFKTLPTFVQSAIRTKINEDYLDIDGSNGISVQKQLYSQSFLDVSISSSRRSFARNSIHLEPRQQPQQQLSQTSQFQQPQHSQTVGLIPTTIISKTPTRENDRRSVSQRSSRVSRIDMYNNTNLANSPLVAKMKKVAMGRDSTNLSRDDGEKEYSVDLKPIGTFNTMSSGIKRSTRYSINDYTFNTNGISQDHPFE